MSGPHASQPRRRFHEAAHKLSERNGNGANGLPATPVRRTFNEAAHKLGYWPVSLAPAPAAERSVVAEADQERDVVAHAGRVVLALGALGVVYGDLGTSPLYAEQVSSRSTTRPRRRPLPACTGSSR